MFRTAGLLIVAAAAAVAPTFTSASPNLGDSAGGGQLVTLTGTNFTGATGVTFGGSAATSVTVTNSTTITCLPPAHALGAVSVVVTTPSGSNGANTGFEYWTPSQITGIDSYLDANKGVTGGAAVSAWLDQSSNARNFVQATAGNKPAQTASVFGALPSVRFASASSQYLQLAARIVLGSGTSIFWVGKWTTSRTTATQIYNAPLTVVGDATAWEGTGAGTNGELDLVTNGGDTRRGTGYNDGAAHLVGWTCDTGGNAKAYAGTAQQGATATGLSYTPASTGYDTIGGGYGSVIDNFNGDLGAVIVVNGVMSGADMTKLNTWSQQRFGTP